ncbi:MAG: hypothetical protein IJ220_05805 [Clostridia bacterium]|nr:hypothetical protein [Clostridia bacterium]
MEEKKTIKKVLIIILIVLVIGILGILFHMVRNFIIISNLQRTVKQYEEITNYHIKTSYDDEAGHNEFDFYRKEDKRAFLIVNTNQSGEVIKLLTYDNGKRVDFFSETPSTKTAQLDVGGSPNFAVTNGLETDSAWDTFLACFLARVKKSEYEGKECFIIKNFLSGSFLYDIEEDCIAYVDKETGLQFLREDGKTTKYEYEFGNVDDSIFIEPNIGEYDLHSSH